MMEIYLSERSLPPPWTCYKPAIDWLKSHDTNLHKVSTELTEGADVG